MVSIAAYTLGFSLVGIMALFSLKVWEMRQDVVYAASLRAPIDRIALRLKQRLSLGMEILEDLPHFLVLVLRWFIHVSSVAVARAARGAERRAYAIADKVSYKRHFERAHASTSPKRTTGAKNGQTASKASRSEFLAQIGRSREETTK